MGTAWANTLTLGVDANIERMASQSHYYYKFSELLPILIMQLSGAVTRRTYGTSDMSGTCLWRCAWTTLTLIGLTSRPKNQQFHSRSPASLRWEFIEGLTGRVSAGLGWRAPLTFFELDHGLLDNGSTLALPSWRKPKERVALSPSTGRNGR